MTTFGTQHVIDALALPASALVGQRVPKTLLVEHGAPTAADKRLIEAGVAELRWVASLKPNTVGVAAFEDSTRQCVELVVLTLAITPESKPARLLELIHRAIPYHTLLIVNHSAAPPILTTADKRWSQSESGRVVLDGAVVTTDVATASAPTAAALLGALSVSRRPHQNLYALYRSWIDALLAAEAARSTGTFAEPASPQHAADRHNALAKCAALEKEIAAVRQAAAKEKQMSRQVDLNLRLKRLTAELADAKSRL